MTTMTTRLARGAVLVLALLHFNMRGWWEFLLAIASARGADTVTFNLAL